MSRYCPERRRFLREAGTISIAGLAALGGLASFSGCGGDGESSRRADGTDTAPPASASSSAAGDAAGPCNDLSNLTRAEIENREVYDYQPRSEYPEELCSNCEYWEPGAEGEKCGGCSLMAGPIHPDGWCSAWSEMG